MGVVLEPRIIALNVRCADSLGWSIPMPVLVESNSVIVCRDAIDT